MKRTTSILLAGMLIAAIAGIGIVSAAVDETDDSTFFGQMYGWAGHGMRYATGYASGYGYANCPVYGAYASDVTTVELEVETIDEAIDIAEDATGQAISESDVYQMGRWWVFNYVEDDDTMKQGRVDAYTGEVIEDFYAGSTYQSQYYQRGRGMGMRGSGYGGYGGCGGAYSY